jgi:hypothetical protein
MKNTLKSDCLFRGVGVVLVVTAGLILVSLALGAEAWVVHEQATLGEILLLLFLATWGKALAIGCVALFAVIVLVRAGTTCRKEEWSQVHQRGRGFSGEEDEWQWYGTKKREWYTPNIVVRKKRAS